MRRSIQVLGAFAVLVALLAAGACGSEGEPSSPTSTADIAGHASWWLMAAPLPGAKDLELTVLHGSCDEVGAAAVHESESAVKIDVPTPWIGKIGPNGAKGCDSAGHLVEMTVHLDAPLGDRQLLGCRHDGQPCATTWGS